MICGETMTAADWFDQSVWFRCLNPIRGRHITLQQLSSLEHLTVDELYVYVANSGEVLFGNLHKNRAVL